MQRNDALYILDKLVGLPLLYGLQSPDVVFFDLGFGEYIQAKNLYGIERSVATYSLHAVCGIKIIHRKEPRHTECYFGDTPAAFNSLLSKLTGQIIKRVALSEKNDLWMDLGDYWIVFVTNEDSEESWRYFSHLNNTSHLVFSDTWIHWE